MLRITAQQRGSFQGASTQRFYQDIVDFFEREDPELFKTLSTLEKLAFVRACHRRAQLYGLKMAASIYAWVDMSILIGSYFHQNIFFDELSDEIKKAATAYDERDCLEQAQAWLAAYLRLVRGENNQHAISALKRIRSFYQRNKRPSAIATEAGQPLAEYVTTLTARLYPELYAYHGAPLVQQQCAAMIRRNRSDYGITGEWHHCCLCILGLSFGVAFDLDELYPWIQRTLDNMARRGPERCVEKLASRSLIWLEHTLKTPRGDT